MRQNFQSRRYRPTLVLHGEWFVTSTRIDRQCSHLFETYLHDHSHRCVPPYRLVGVFSVQGWWHRSYCGARRCHTCTHIRHEADPPLSLPGVSTLTVETKQTVRNKTQTTRDKCWTVYLGRQHCALSGMTQANDSLHGHSPILSCSASHSAFYSHQYSEGFPCYL